MDLWLVLVLLGLLVVHGVDRERRLRRASRQLAQARRDLHTLEQGAAAGTVAPGHAPDRVTARTLTHRAYHDPLTALGTRSLLVEHADRALAAERLRPVGVLHLDLDDFTKVNESLGRGAGDRVLRRLADCLSAGLGAGDVAARVGGDEFAVLLGDVASADGARRAGERLLAALSAPVDLGDGTVNVQASIGVAVGHAGVTSTDELLRNATVAMYVAKGQGKGCVRLFEPVMHTAILERLELEAQLEVAVERAQLDLRYQPIVSLVTGRVHGFEAMVRWNHPERGELPPEVFLPIAEETGLVTGIDRWVLLKACCQGRAWQRAYPAEEPLLVSVNLAPRQLEEDNAVELVQLSLEVSGLAPEHLVIEVTERFLERGDERGIAVLGALRDIGVRLAIDHFGVGCSALPHLRHLPIDVLKIDPSFVDGLGRSDEDTALVQAILRLARTLGLETIAEGVERPDQRAALADLGCTLAQGWHFARPLRSAEMEDLLRTRTAALPLRV